ncbi:MAG: TolC family protein [Terriglobales bacterium]
MSGGRAHPNAAAARADRRRGGRPRPIHLASAASALLLALLLAGPLSAQVAPASKPSQAISAVTVANTAVPSRVDFANVSLFPHFWRAYTPWRMPALNLANPASLDAAARSGTIALSLQRVIVLALADNLDIASADYERLFAQADLLRTRSGAAARGVSGAVSTTSLFRGAIGTGVGGGGGGVSGSAGGVLGGVGGLRAPSGGSYDPTLSFYFDTEHAKSPLNSPIIYGTPISEDNETVGAASYSQAFPTGTSLSISGAAVRDYLNTDQLFFNPELVSGVSLGIGQNIFPGGFSATINREFIIVAQNNRHVADAVFRQKVIQIVAEAAEQYWDLAESQQEARVAAAASRYAGQLLADTRDLVARGRAPESQLIQVESQRTTLRQNELTLDIQARQQATKLKLYLARDWTPTLIAAQLEATDALPSPQGQPQLSEEAVIQQALRNRPEIQEDQYNLKTRELEAKVTATELQPSLWAGASITASGLSGLQVNCAVNQFPCPASDLRSPLPGGISQAFTESLHVTYPDYAVGFELEIPILNRAGRADQARAALDLAQERVIIRDQENQLAQQVDSDLIALDGAVAKLQDVTASRNLAEQTLANAKAKYQMGATTVFTVIDAQKALLQLQTAAIQARADYAKAQIQLAAASGTILSQYHVELRAPRRAALTPAAGGGPITPTAWRIPRLTGANP